MEQHDGAAYGYDAVGDPLGQAQRRRDLKPDEVGELGPVKGHDGEQGQGQAMDHDPGRPFASLPLSEKRLYGTSTPGFTPRKQATLAPSRARA